MLNYLATQDESKCCGCGACVEICPPKALSMKPNKEGFQYPALDANRLSIANCARKSAQR